MTQPLVALAAAAVGYGGRPILEGVDVAVSPGDFLALVGPNGGGKTTIMLSLLGALPLVAGRRERPRPWTGSPAGSILCHVKYLTHSAYST